MHGTTALYSTGFSKVCGLKVNVFYCHSKNIVRANLIGICDTTENNSENGYRTSDKHTVPLCSTALNYLQDLYQVVKSRFQATATAETKNLFLSANQVLPRYNNESFYVCMYTLLLTHLDIVCVSHTYTFIVNIHTFILIFVHGHIYILMLCTVYLITSTQVTRTACGLNK
jgi:hypothetical protein